MLRPDVVPLEDDEVSEPDSNADPDDENASSSGGRPGDAGSTGGDETRWSSFYALFELDRLRGAAQVADILEHIAAHLGDDVELSLELRAKADPGYTDATRRTVSENATNLGAKASEFE